MPPTRAPKVCNNSRETGDAALPARAAGTLLPLIGARLIGRTPDSPLATFPPLGVHARTVPLLSALAAASQRTPPGTGTRRHPLPPPSRRPPDACNARLPVRHLRVLIATDGGGDAHASRSKREGKGPSGEEGAVCPNISAHYKLIAA